MAQAPAAGEFPGAGVFRFSSTDGWRQQTAANASSVAVDGNGDVLAEFPGSSLWRYQDATGRPAALAAGRPLPAGGGSVR